MISFPEGIVILFLKAEQVLFAYTLFDPPVGSRFKACCHLVTHL